MEQQTQPQQNHTETEDIAMDTTLIDNNILKFKIYTKPDVATIVLYNPVTNLNLTPEKSNPNSKYLANIQSNFNYIGILSDSLTREIFGKNKYQNGDWYVGDWEKNQKDKFGIYSYNTNNPNAEEFYFGEWVQGKKQGKGIYLWKHSGSSVTSLSQSYYKAVIGQFDKDMFDKGLAIEKVLSEKDNSIAYIIYEGTFNSKWKKDGKDCILIENTQVFYGEFSNGEMQNGAVVVFNQINEIIQSFSFTTNKEETNKYVFNPHNEAKAEVNKRAIKIMAKVNKLQLFKSVEEFYSSFVPLDLHFSNIEKFQVPSFQAFFSSLIEYLTNTFTLMLQ